LRLRSALLYRQREPLSLRLVDDRQQSVGDYDHWLGFFEDGFSPSPICTVQYVCPKNNNSRHTDPPRRGYSQTSTHLYYCSHRLEPLWAHFEYSCYLHHSDIHPPSRGHSLFFSTQLHCYRRGSNLRTHKIQKLIRPLDLDVHSTESIPKYSTLLLSEDGILTPQYV
jgi:hypothetical protein